MSSAEILSLPANEVLKKLQEGRHSPHDCGSPMDKKPNWLKMEHFHRGRQVFLNHPYSVSTGTVVGIFWMAQVSSLIVPLLFTKKSSTIPKVRRRLLSTVKHVHNWYNGDAWNASDEAYRSIELVRQVHDRVSQRLNNPSSTNDDATTPWITQYDMALTQFTFLSANVLYPEKLSLFISDEDMMCLIHFWAGIGYLLGIEDRYNLGLQCNTLQENRALFLEIVECVVKPSLLSSKVEFEDLLFRVAQAYRIEVDPFGEHGSLMYFAFEMIGVPVTIQSDWDMTICRTAHSAIIACVNTPVIGYMINAYALHVLKRASGSQLSFVERVLNALLNSLRFINKVFSK